MAAMVLLAPASVPAQELYFYLEEGRVVFTNVPSRADARVVPGFAARVQSARSRVPASPWDREIAILGARYGVPSDLIQAVAWVESGYDPQAVSAKGAMGLMQLMPETARRYGVRQPFDPYESLRAGTALLRDLLDAFDGDMTLALAAYNAGAGAVQRHGGVPDYPETRAYLERIASRLGAGRKTFAAGPPKARSLQIEVEADGTIRVSN